MKNYALRANITSSVGFADTLVTLAPPLGAASLGSRGKYPTGIFAIRSCPKGKASIIRAA